MLTSESGASTDSLTWSPVGQLASMTTSGGTTGYIYDADGNLLIQTDPSSTTLYLSDEEITLTGSTLTGTRYYQLGGQTVAARTGAGAVYYLSGDQEGTQTLAINSTSLAVSDRFYDPYGNPVGAGTGAWPGGRGFQEGTTDTATGLTNLGAREYVSATGAFASPDPLINPTDPQDLNPYAYAQDSPPTSEDPSGQYSIYGDGSGSYVGTGQSYENTQGGQGSGGTGSSGGSGKAPSGGSDGTGNFVQVSPHVVIETNSPYYTSMIEALDNLLSTNPGYASLLSKGNINTGDWVWNQACRAAGTGACSPLFMAQTTPGGNTAPLNGTLFIGPAFGPAGFAVGSLVGSSSSSGSGGESGPGEGDAGGGPSIPDSTIIARGGQSDLPPPGEVFSGAQGQTIEEAGQGVVHGSFRWTTAGAIREAGGTVEPAPEYNAKIGQYNFQHVDVCLGEGPCEWSELTQNVPKSQRFGGSDYPFEDGYMEWGP